MFCEVKLKTLETAYTSFCQNSRDLSSSQGACHKKRNPIYCRCRKCYSSATSGARPLCPIIQGRTSRPEAPRQASSLPPSGRRILFRMFLLWDRQIIYRLKPFSTGKDLLLPYNLITATATLSNMLSVSIYRRGITGIFSYIRSERPASRNINPRLPSQPRNLDPSMAWIHLPNELCSRFERLQDPEKIATPCKLHVCWALKRFCSAPYCREWRTGRIKLGDWISMGFDFCP